MPEMLEKLLYLNLVHNGETVRDESEGLLSSETEAVKVKCGEARGGDQVTRNRLRPGREGALPSS